MNKLLETGFQIEKRIVNLSQKAEVQFELEFVVCLSQKDHVSLCDKCYIHEPTAKDDNFWVIFEAIVNVSASRNSQQFMLVRF